MEILTERLLLRPFAPGDMQDMYEYLSQPAVHCFECMRLHSFDEAEGALRERMGQPLYFAIVVRETGKVIGEIFTEAEATAPEQAVKDTYSPCWMLNSAYRGKGYMTEAVRALYDHLFGALGARRIYIYTEEDNLACQHVCEKLGMRREGVFREFVSFVCDEQGEPIYETTLQYAILKKEWDAQTRALPGASE